MEWSTIPPKLNEVGIYNLNDTQIKQKWASQIILLMIDHAKPLHCEFPVKLELHLLWDWTQILHHWFEIGQVPMHRGRTEFITKVLLKLINESLDKNMHIKGWML